VLKNEEISDEEEASTDVEKMNEALPLGNDYRQQGLMLMKKYTTDARYKVSIKAFSDFDFPEDECLEDDLFFNETNTNQDGQSDVQKLNAEGKNWQINFE